jgi:hypothetical protein
MSLNPIDVMRSQEASQVRYHQSMKQQNEQIQISRNLQQTIQREKSKPNQTTKADDKEFRYDAKERGNNQYQGFSGKKKEKDDKNTKDEKKPSQHGGFDILI